MMFYGGFKDGLCQFQRCTFLKKWPWSHNTDIIYPLVMRGLNILLPEETLKAFQNKDRQAAIESFLCLKITSGGYDRNFEMSYMEACLPSMVVYHHR